MNIYGKDGKVYATFEPDPERDSPDHRHIVRADRIDGTVGGNYLLLDCGHTVTAFGNLKHAEGVVLCGSCRAIRREKENQKAKWHT